ncbi:NAD(P)H-quinone oxidoreductase subunit 5 [Nonlabens dokdonensis]|uniref:pH adaptation potassium efflux system protein A n=2 Tax=Nonlabens dokdonensis TaxID=328515 RepID=L7WH25_NONDD|nr:proton-conducting transporter membrane subunit [Nonlabens dokdonensis]AGC78258.1 pH adaptation potassium efflux system protein A [Nonlabens dokdonensis DSW-6]PZX37855.1 NAD(P)H-quinone oxidoreductase subunit 5 [Nonlabens dokdonensis]
MTSHNNLLTDASVASQANSPANSSQQLSKIFNVVLWLSCLINIGVLVFFFPDIPEWNYNNLLIINGFTVLIWATVTFFSALISSYSKNYLIGFRYASRFKLLSFGFTLALMLFVMSNHVALIILSWLLIGFLMSRLIGVDREWAEAREAAKFTLKYFLAGTFFLAAGLGLLAFQLDNYFLKEMITQLDNLPYHIVLIAAICIIIAAIIQSAIYPFHKWLLSAMTSPTPASALMHAGFVNGSGILLALFASLIFVSETHEVLLIIGGLTAIMAQFTKLIQVNVKHKLACSTIAQMGFMIMQCGLGFYNAAVVHLILHGFYKAYLFLSSGEEIKHSAPQESKRILIKPLQAVAVLIFGTIAAIFFSFITGKGTALDSGIFLTLIVAITVGQVTYNIVKEKSLSTGQKIIIPAVLFLLGIGAYGLMYNAVTAIMSDMPYVAQALPLSAVQIIFGIVFLLGFFIMKLGYYRKIPWLYVKLLNDSQPYKKTILTYKSKS